MVSAGPLVHKAEKHVLYDGEIQTESKRLQHQDLPRTSRSSKNQENLALNLFEVCLANKLRGRPPIGRSPPKDFGGDLRYICSRCWEANNDHTVQNRVALARLQDRIQGKVCTRLRGTAIHVKENETRCHTHLLNDVLWKLLTFETINHQTAALCDLPLFICLFALVGCHQAREISQQTSALIFDVWELRSHSLATQVNFLWRDLCLQLFVWQGCTFRTGHLYEFTMGSNSYCTLLWWGRSFEFFWCSNLE